ncbi:hypothetical protein [Thioalkalivibrio sp. ALE19]|uniref:hypothetical protein n=1 Tax=Thioalkalivibrio sp. ALE19 TaxID=1266909 RepID=UPI0012DF6AA6|nr:hypothetical protein [Thioalkalivibrio sp. ALE19]
MHQDTTITATCEIPQSLLNTFDRMVLQEMGFNWSKECAEKMYLFMEGPQKQEWQFDLHEARTIQSTIRESYPRNGFYPSWVEDMENSLETILEDMEATGEYAGGMSLPDWAEIIHGAVQKPENSGENRIESIAFQAAYWANKARPFEFGGYVVRITPAGIQTIGVDHILAFMERGGEIDPSGKLTSMPEQEKTERKPQILNGPKPGDRTYEAIVTRDTTESAVVRVFAEDEEEAATIMTDHGHASKAVFEVDEGNHVREYYLGDPDAIEDVSGFVPF